MLKIRPGYQFDLAKGECFTWRFDRILPVMAKQSTMIYGEDKNKNTCCMPYTEPAWILATVWWYITPCDVQVAYLCIALWAWFSLNDGLLSPVGRSALSLGAQQVTSSKPAAGHLVFSIRPGVGIRGFKIIALGGEWKYMVDGCYLPHRSAVSRFNCDVNR